MINPALKTLFANEGNNLYFMLSFYVKGDNALRNVIFKGGNSSELRKIAFLAISFYLVFGFSNVGYLLPIYYKQIGVKSTDAAGLLVGVFYIASVMSRPFLGGVVNVLGFRRLFYLSGFLSITSSIVVYLAGTSFWPGFIARAVLGISAGLFQVGLGTYQALAFEPSRRGRAFSLIMAGGLAPMMTIVPIADILLKGGHNTIYILIPLLICVAASVITPSIPGLDSVTPHNEGDKTVSTFRGIVECFKIRPLRIAFLSCFLFSISDATAAFMGSMAASVGLMASLFLSPNAVVGVIMRLFFGGLLDKFHRGFLASITTLVTASALLLATFFPSEQMFIALGMIYGVGMGLGFPLHLALVSDCAPRELQAQAVSMSWFLMGMSFSVVPLISGSLESWLGAVTSFRLMVAPAFLGAFLTYFCWKRCEGKKLDINTNH